MSLNEAKELLQVHNFKQVAKVNTNSHTSCCYRACDRKW